MSIDVSGVVDFVKRYAKFFVAAGAAGAIAVKAGADDQFTSEEVYSVVFAFLGAAGVVSVPNKKK